MSGCSSDEPVPARVEVSLYHCGLEALSLAGGVWEAAAPEVDATNVPPEWRGRGTLTQVSPAELRYRDDSGIEVTFVPDAEVPPVGCA